jgi:hypothetical protein
VSVVDCITAVLAIPAVEEDGEQRDARPGEAVLDEHFATLSERFSKLNTPAEDGSSTLEQLLGDFLGQTVSSHAIDFTYYEKKGLVYPALVFHTAGITNATGEPLAELITKRFRDDAARYKLAELLGHALAVDWVSVFTTFGPEQAKID